MTKTDFYTRLVYARQRPVIGKLAYYLLKLLGSEIPISVPIGPGFILEHGGQGVVVHSKAKIGSGVHIYQGVTIGRADIYLPSERSKFEGVEIGDNVILCSGCKVLCKEGILRVGDGTVVGANAVLLKSTGDNEIWAGAPARCVGQRPNLGGE
ncbi:MAG: serine acetyltransferase [Chloroflexota bacterium]|jgi:serine O-acetyltransferase|nr:serine acetyltransferase [Chloroflexota bacterium]